MENPNASAASSKVITHTDEIISTAASTNSTNINPALRSLNKSSYKIFKPPSSSKNLNPISNPNPISNLTNLNPNPNPQPQPPVFNVAKSNFRERVQKLTGSPAASHPPPPRPPAKSSRLHRIRPPPLSSIGPTSPPHPESWGRPALSLLPPLSSVSTATESPITAYMRRLRGVPSPTAGLVQQLQQQPLSPLGCSGVAMIAPTLPRLPRESPRIAWMIYLVEYHSKLGQLALYISNQVTQADNSIFEAN